MKKTRNHSPGTVQDYRCHSCSGGTARNFPGEPIRDRGCIECLLKLQGSLLHALRHLLTTREQQSALQRYIEASQALAKQRDREPKHRGHHSARAPRPERDRRPAPRLPRPESRPSVASSAR